MTSACRDWHRWFGLMTRPSSSHEQFQPGIKKLTNKILYPKTNCNQPANMKRWTRVAHFDHLFQAVTGLSPFDLALKHPILQKAHKSFSETKNDTPFALLKYQFLTLLAQSKPTPKSANSCTTCSSWLHFTAGGLKNINVSNARHQPDVTWNGIEHTL